MTKIKDLKGSKAVPQSSSLSAQAPVDLTSGGDDMKWINSVNMEWGKHVFARMDEDEKLWTTDPYVLKDAEGNDLVDVISVTMNDARIFGDKVLAVLNESEEVIEVNGQKDGKEMDGHQSAIVEDWWHDLLYMANEHLNDILLPDLDSYLWEQICIRGRMGVRVLLSQDDYGFAPDILPIDMRKCVYAVGRSGLSKVAFWETLDKDACKQEYPDYNPIGETVNLWNFWNGEKEKVFLDGTFFPGEDNKLGYPPFVIQLSQQGTFLDTSPRALRMRGDSIYSANRDLYPELNRMASILETMNMLSLSPPQVLSSESGQKLPDEPIYRLGRILAIKNGEKLEPIKAPDIIGSTRFFMATLTGALQRGSLSYVDWGNLEFQLSNVALATLGAASKQVFTPRIKAMERFKRKLCREVINQFVQFDMSASIGRSGKKRTYTADDLRGEYTVDFEYITSLPEETAAAYGLANMAKPWMDDKSIRKTILKYKDYDDVDEKVLVQTAQQVSRALALLNMAQALDKQGKTDEAKVLLVEMGQALAGIAPQEVGKITGVEPPKQLAMPPVGQGTPLTMAGPGAPTTGATRTTRKAETPGAGEFEQEAL